MHRFGLLSRHVATLILLAFLASCDAPTATRGARFVVISAPARTDTILALPSRPLVIELRDDDNRAVPNALVSVRGRVAQSSDSILGLVGVSACAAEQPVCILWTEQFGWVGADGARVITDSRGRVAVRVQFGQVAGATAVDVRHVGTETQLAVPFETRAGAIAGGRTPVPDTVVYVGGTYALAAGAADRMGNPVPGTVTVTALDPSVATYSTGRVTAVGVGRARFAMSAGGGTDTAFLSVPPRGRIAAVEPPATPGGLARLTLVNLDGSDRRPLVETRGNSGFVIPTWAPTKDRVIYQEADASSSFNVVLRVVDTLGSSSRALSVQPGVGFAMQPAVSHSEGMLYLFGNSDAGSGIYRVSPDGNAASYLFPAVQPGPSPDGSKVAHVLGTAAIVRDLSSGAETLLGEGALLPRWSPAGDVVAYIKEDIGGLMVVRPDGTQSRQLGAPRRYDAPVTFSPDGIWVLAASEGRMELIRVSDELRLPLLTLRGFTQATWR